jgi:hypothetical protein
LNFPSSTFSPYFSPIHSDYMTSPLLSYELNICHYIRSNYQLAEFLTVF